MTEVFQADTRKEANATPDRQVRRWLLELKLADKREREWKKVGKTIWKRYKAAEAKKSAFNILWANTETLRPALYNSPPKPDVRRRFRQSDMLGKAVGELSERALSYCVDAYDLDGVIKQDVLEALLPGRGISRVRYVPTFKPAAAAIEAGESPEAATHDEGAEEPHDEEAFEGEREEVDYEQCLCEHVQWDDFRHGPGKTWAEVTWCGFRHKLTRDDLIERFGEEIGNEIKLDATDDEDVQKKENEDLEDIFKRAELWEIWNKDEQRVFFVTASYRKDLIYPIAEPGEVAEKGEPPLKLRNFFPVPMPLRLVEDTQSMVPTPLYEQYREQAEELDRISLRINKLIQACRVRGLYDSTLSEFSELMKSDDSDMIPVSQARAWMNNGGIEKAVWWMPVEQIAKVLRELYVAREACKSTIYELTGISDIVRGDTDPNETLGAQQLKANYSSIRLQRMQKETQRYIRDLIRLMAEVIGENFSTKTLAQMTGMNFPTAQQKQQMQLMAQGQPLAPEQQQAMQNALKMPTWEDIMAVLQSDLQREFRVDVETDSTIAETLSQDMRGLQEVLTAIVQFWQGVGPAVQAQAVSMDAVKAITMSIVRRARMGLEVEDAIETGLKEPKPQADPNAGKAQAEAAAQAHQQQLAAAQAQHQALLAQQQQAHDQQIAQRQQAHEEQIAQRQAIVEQQRAQAELQQSQQQAMLDAAFERFKALLDARTKVETAEIAAGAQIQAGQIGAAREATAQ